MHGGIAQGIAAFGYIQEGERARVTETQGNVQVPQSDIAVHAQDPGAGAGQCNAHARADGSFSGTALAGHHSHYNAQW